MTTKKPEPGGIAASLLGFVLFCALGLVLFVLFFQEHEPAAPPQAPRVRLENAEANFSRLKPLWDQRVISRHEFDQTRTELDSAQAELSRLLAEKQLTLEQLQDALITAPVDGVISRRLVDIGAFVSTGEHLATVYLRDRIEAVFTIPERHMGRVKPGQPVEISVDAYPERAFAAAVTFVSPEVNETTRDFLVKAAVEDTRKVLKPGAFAAAVVTVNELPDRPVIPEEALVATRRGYFVFVVENQTARMRQVEIGLRQVGLVEITRGLGPFEVVIRSGHLQVADGEAVRIIN